MNNFFTKIIHFMPLVSFYGLMMFSGVIEKDQSHEMVLWLFLEITKRERELIMLVNTTKMKIAYRN